MRRSATKSTLLIFAWLLWPPSAQGQTPPTIDVQVDRDPVTVGEPFSLSIRVEAQGSNEPDIRLPVLTGLRVLSRSESHPMSMSFSFGLGTGATRSVSRQSVYEMVVVADRPGTYRIDPVVVTLDGRQYKSSTKMIRAVGRGDPTPQSPADPGTAEAGVQIQSVQPGDLTADDLRGAKVDPDYFVQTHLSKTKAVVGERLVLTVYVYFSRNISGVELVREPGTEGLWVENLLPTGRRPDVEQVTIGGVSYGRVAERRIAVFPISTGTLTIAPPVAEYTIQRGFFSAPKTIKRAGIPVTLEVSELPKEGKPAGFVPVNVGHYSFEATIDTSTVKVGEPVTVTMVATGQGNVRNVALPELGEVVGFKSYAPELEADVRVEGDTVLGSRTSKTLLIAKEPGEFRIPAVDFAFFDPQTGKYDTIHVPERVVTVTAADTPSSGSAPPSTGPSKAIRVEDVQTGLERLNRQLRSIVSAADLVSAAPGSAPSSAWFLLVAVGAPVAWLGFLAFGLIRRRRAEGWMRDRSKRADSEALRRLAELGRQGSAVDSAAFHTELARVLFKFLEDRLEEPVSGATMPELRDHLRRRGFDESLIERLVAEMESLDFARFAQAAGSEPERQASLERLRQLIAELAAVRIRPVGGGK